MSRTRNSSEAGFTLAGLIVMMTVIAIFIAYTVPKQWAIAVARDRDQQTLFAMKQYARAIREFQVANKVAPVSLDQLKQKAANGKRVLRGGLVDPLTGQFDWIVIPAGSPQQQAAQQQATPVDLGPIVGVGGNRRTMPAPPQTSVPVNPQQQSGQPGGFSGPIMGVRPNKTGQSYLTVNGFDTYEQWSYTTIDLQNEITTRMNAMMAK